MSTMREFLMDVAQAVHILDDSTFTWFGSRSATLPSKLRTALPPTALRAHLVASLQEQIYRDAYCPGTVRPSTSKESFDSAVGGLSALLEAANAGVGTLDPGWTVVEIAPHSEQRNIGLRSRGLQLWVASEDCGSTNSDAIAIGDNVAVRLPPGSFEVSPGYYSAFGDEAMQPADGELIRIYFAVRPDSAPDAMRRLTQRLNTIRVPFRLKMLRDASAYTRSDTAVLYLPVEATIRAAEALESLSSHLDGMLNLGVPAFTLPAAPGIGLAEEPDEQSSFGEHRSSLIAEGLVRAAEQGAPRGVSQQRRDTIAQPWEERGISLDRPYLNSKSNGVALETLRQAIAGSKVASSSRRIIKPVTEPSKSSEPADSAPAPPSNLSVAMLLGQELVDTAVWHGNKCTWLAMVPSADRDGRPALSYGAVGPSLYDGTAGIGIFLAMLARTTNSAQILETAVAAARQALGSLPTLPGDGFYTGWPGSALASGLVGVSAEVPALLSMAVDTALQRAPSAGRETDLLSGRAGTALALLSLGTLSGEERLVSEAVRLGHGLIRDARVTARGLSWPNLAADATPDLTGISHGAAGVGALFVELEQSTGDARFGAAAREAFRYERSWYSSHHGNWPDLREAAIDSPPEATHPYLSQWCHGAPGIALVRLKAAEALGDPILYQEAATALRTTIFATNLALGNSGFSFSLCHGLAGNADVLLEGIAASRVVPDLLLNESEIQEAERLVARIADHGRITYASGQRPWSCGIPVPGVVVPSLMLGTAGIGYHYLRLADPQTLPSVLLPNASALVRWATLPIARNSTRLVGSQPEGEPR